MYWFDIAAFTDFGLLVMMVIADPSRETRSIDSLSKLFSETLPMVIQRPTTPPFQSNFMTLDGYCAAHFDLAVVRRLGIPASQQGDGWCSDIFDTS